MVWIVGFLGVVVVGVLVVGLVANPVDEHELDETRRTGEADTDFLDEWPLATPAWVGHVL